MGRSEGNALVMAFVVAIPCAYRYTKRRLTRSVRRAGPQNLYQLLKLSPLEVAGASTDSLKQRQRAILRICHPDIAGAGGAALTSVLAEAVALLGSTAGRIEYEARLQGNSLQSPSEPIEVMPG
eukprot:g29264.t1